MPREVPLRIVSLIASATEIVCALGRRDRLVGRSHECDFPADVAALPQLTAPKFKVEGTSAEIDARVHADRARRPLRLSRRRRRAESARARRHRHPGPLRGVRGQPHRRGGRHLHLDRPAGRRSSRSSPTPWPTPTPTSAASPRALERSRGGRGARRAICSAASPPSPRRVAGRRTAPRRLHRMGRAADGRRQLDAGADRSRRRPQPVRRGRQALRLDAVGGARRRRPRRHRRRPLRLRPRPLPRGAAAAAKPSPAGPASTAVREGRVYFADGNAYFNRPGPRLADSAEMLAEMLHPEIAGTPAQGTAWVRIAVSSHFVWRGSMSSRRIVARAAAPHPALSQGHAARGRSAASTPVVQHRHVLGLGEEQPALDDQADRHRHRRQQRPADLRQPRRYQRQQRAAMGTANASSSTSGRSFSACLRAIV